MSRTARQYSLLKKRHQKQSMITIVAITLLLTSTSGLLRLLFPVGYSWVIPIGIFILIGLFYLGYTSFAKWTGFGEYLFPLRDKDAPQFQRSKTLWDWLQLLIIPVVLATGALWFNMQQNQVSQTLNAQQHASDVQMALDQQREVAPH